MTKKTKAFDVNITAATESWGYFDPDVVHCNRMTADEIKVYMDEIRHYHKIPSDFRTIICEKLFKNKYMKQQEQR